MADIKEVVAEAFFDACVATPSVDLSVTGKAAAHRAPEIIAGKLRTKFPHKFRTFGPGAHEAHVAAQNVPELREFIESQAAQKPTDPGASRIAGDGPHRAQVTL